MITRMVLQAKRGGPGLYLFKILIQNVSCLFTDCLTISQETIFKAMGILNIGTSYLHSDTILVSLSFEYQNYKIAFYMTTCELLVCFTLSHLCQLFSFTIVTAFIMRKLLVNK